MAYHDRYLRWSKNETHINAEGHQAHEAVENKEGIMKITRAAVEVDVLRNGLTLYVEDVDPDEVAVTSDDLARNPEKYFLEKGAARALMDSMIAAGVKPTREIEGMGEAKYLRSVVDRLLLLTLPEVL